MLNLPNGCRCSTPTLLKSKRGYRIVYRFYDPAYPKPKFVEIKAGLNGFDKPRLKIVADAVISEVLDKLQNRGYNPFTNSFNEETLFYEIDPDTPFPTALEQARIRLKLEPHTLRDIKSIVKGIGKAAAQLQISSLPVSKVSRKHLKACIEQYGKIAKQFSEIRYNAYRSYLIMLFTELVELEAVFANPAKDLKKLPVTQKIKKVASQEERDAINKYLLLTAPRFYHFVHLFFHSGGRKTELIQLKPSDVNLEKQTYRCIIKKGRKKREVERTIKTVAIRYWQYFLKDCPGDQFIFGTNLYPGKQPMGVDMPSRWWQRYVKQDLKINVDLYSLKHLHTTELVDLLDEDAAAEMNKHTGTAMVKSIYDVKNKQRHHDRLKGAGNQF